MINIETAKILEKNWVDVKNEMRKNWRKLSELDIQKIDNHKDLVKKLKSLYKISEEEVEDKINLFIDKYDLKTDLSRLDEIKQAFYNKASDTKEKVGEVVKDSAEVIQEKAEVWTDFLSTYAKENPLKTLGLGVVAGIAIKKLLSSNTVEE